MTTHEEVKQVQRYVEEREYYHIERGDPNLVVGNTYFIGRGKNRFVGKYDTRHSNFTDSQGKGGGS